MKVVPLITVALILCITFLGSIQAKKKPKFCVGKDGKRYEVGQGYDDNEGKDCIHYKCTKNKKKFIMKKSKCGPDMNVKMAALELSIQSLNESMQNLLEMMTTLQSIANKQGTCLMDLSSCPDSAPGKTGVVDGIAKNILDIRTNTAGLASNKVSVSSNTADIISNKGDIISNTDICSSIKTTTTDLKNCLSDVNNCPASDDGKTSVSDAITKNKDSIVAHHSETAPVTTTTLAPPTEPELMGWCESSDGQDQNSGTTNLAGGSKEDCYYQCKAVTQATGCEWYSITNACLVHTLDVATGSGNNGFSLNFRCWVFKTSQKGKMK